ncbi:MAG: 50S ribosomal protein L11 [Candidatus Aenigmarchaeota archaeon]|nr:50S ribosomal protein L11 [Candidatus Aenigmarchaeota archaeon]MCX8179434.1 50S ribosomal protein L11 [Candidatus Aenigmarchaeota archaeon]
MSKETIEMLVEGGNAKPGPTTAPKFSQYKINIGELFNKINQETKEYKGMNVPVKVIIDTETKEYTIKVGVPPVASLIKKELGLEKIGGGSSSKKDKDAKKGAKEEKTSVPQERKIVGNLTIEQCIKIAKMKQSGLLSKTLKNAVKEVVGACVSMPITIEGKSPKQVIKEIEKGLYDNKLQ